MHRSLYTNDTIIRTRRDKSIFAMPKTVNYKRPTKLNTMRVGENQQFGKNNTASLVKNTGPYSISYTKRTAAIDSTRLIREKTNDKVLGK